MDLITKIGKSVVHHGTSNNRIYLMSLDVSDMPFIIGQLERLASKNGYTKVIAKVPRYAKELFESSGYKEEAMIPKFYNGKEDACFLAKFFDEKRQVDPFKDHCAQVLEWSKSKNITRESRLLDSDFSCRKATKQDVEEMALLYQEVFKTYPFPIHDKNYLLKTMNDNVIYFGIWHRDKLVALSSIEAAIEYSNAELTDFASLEAYRGKGLASYLLGVMESEMKQLGLQKAYTIARAKSYGMNITFAKRGYLYAGTLINNTNIYGDIESMNIWYKALI